MEQELVLKIDVPDDADAVHGGLAQASYPIGWAVREVSRLLYSLSHSKDVVSWPTETLPTAVNALLAVDTACRLWQEHKLGAALAMAELARQHAERLPGKC